MRCINCRIAVQRLRRHEVSSLPLPLQNRLTQWMNIEVPLNEYICHPCFNLLNSGATENTRVYGHAMVCRGCGISVRGSRYYTIDSDNPLLAIVLSWDDQQYNIGTTMCYTCRACWTRANRNLIQNALRDVQEDISQVVDVQSQSTLPEAPPMPVSPLVSPQQLLQRNISVLNLPNYKRTSNTSSHCIFSLCNNQSLHLVPTFIKRMMIQDYNLYIPRSCRVCEEHLYSNEWHLLPQNTTLFSTFTCNQIENLIDLAKSKCEILDFENVLEMPNHVCHYWTGLTVVQFVTLLNCIPNIQSKQPKRALGIYLVKLRTGENNRRLSTLFDMPRTSLQNIMAKARRCLEEHFVPQNIGVNSITHADIVNKNLLIPEALFGNPEATPEHRPAIAIFDGTYIFLQKSANYLFQKKTYSLHKYDNLVKPFVIVSCDGYIIDVIGPYAATQSDADIMTALFHDEHGSFRTLFRENDVFILDRGFRDSIPFLENLNFRVYKPESLEEGQHQLTSSQANKSRKVTLCRWVVEIVNGRFKRDFKLFRQRYFNLASPHLMIDFKIAAALLNKFHPRVRDSPNAHQIIERVQRFMEEPNHLGQYIKDYNINRMRATFTRIDASLPQLQEFPRFTYNDLLLFSLGPYQVRQARSYYAEHIRQNGMYQVEVCPNLEHSDEIVFRIGGNYPYLMRGRIKSRHVSQRIYFCYILFDREPVSNCPLDIILGYYCSCLVGNRTVGCCCHIMTIIWYLGWARHQSNIASPASFLNNILLRLDND